MKRIKSRFALFLILCSLVIPVLSFTPIPEVKGAEQVFFEDNFENYNIGTFPSTGGWELWYNGAGTEQQIIVDNVPASPTKSLQLLGKKGWAAYAAKALVTDSPKIGFSVSVRVEAIEGDERDVARVGFAKNLIPNRICTYAPVLFTDNGTICVMNQILQFYVTERWYNVTVIMDRNSETYSVWIDSILQGENLPVMTNQAFMADGETWEIEALGLSQNYYSTRAYFDDVKVFSVFEVNPRLELVPNKGIAATTLVGSGFAPNSKISVTWDDTLIPTVPSPLITDGYGNFTGIISVLNQTTSGIYTVRAVDEMENGATATFTVTIEVPEQTQTVPENTSLVISVLSPENRTYSVRDVPLEYTVNRAFYSATYSLDAQANVTITGNITLTGLSEGPHSIVIYIEDVPGNISSSETVYFTVAPAFTGITILSPENKTYNTSDVPLTYTKNETCTWAYFSLDGQGNYTEPGNTTLLGLADGAHQLMIYVNYTGSFIGEEITVHFTVNTTIPDTSPPIISVISPANTTYTSSNISLTFTVNDPTAMMGYNLDGQANVTITGNTTLTGLFDGTHFITVYANDTSGNTAYSNITYFTVASPTPGISIQSPENRTYNISDILLTFTKNETCYYVAYSLDEQPAVNTENITTLSGLADGTHQLTLYANYTDSSTVESATVWFTVDTNSPNITDIIQAPVDSNGTLEEGVRINATVTDTLSGIERVALNYTDGNGTWTISEMTNLEGDVWNGTIPAFPHSTNVTYTLVAEDKAGNTVTTEELYGQPNQYQVLPEFPLWIILPLFLIATASTIVARKRITIPAFTKISNKLHKLLT